MRATVALRLTRYRIDSAQNSLRYSRQLFRRKAHHARNRASEMNQRALRAIITTAVIYIFNRDINEPFVCDN